VRGDAEEGGAMPAPFDDEERVRRCVGGHGDEEGARRDGGGEGFARRACCITGGSVLFFSFSSFYATSGCTYGGRDSFGTCLGGPLPPCYIFEWASG
jgi:hypothetical protein